MMKTANFSGARMRLLGATCLAGVMLALPAHAQTASQSVPAPVGEPATDATAVTPGPVETLPAGPVADGANEAGASSEIVVTGSRLGGGFTAPTPVTTVGQAQIQQRAIVAVSELLQEVPQLRQNQNIGKSSEPVGQSLADLRGLGPARTLVLFDGRRIAATSPFGGIDTNIFPVSLISNVDVVTGGASAAYGSDAVAGVINFAINKKLEGIRVDASYGISKYDDFKRPVLSAAAGRSFLDGRLHLTIAGDYYRNSGQTRQAERPWGRNQTVLINNPQAATNGLPANFIADGARYSYMTTGGVIAVSPFVPATGAITALRGIQFGPGGVTIPYRYGNPIGNVYAVGGDGGTVQDDGSILPLIRRWVGYGRASFDISDSVSVWGDLLYSRVKVNSDLGPNADQPTVNTTTGAATAGTGLTIQRDNAYLPANVRTIMFANALTSFIMGRTNAEDGFAENNSIARAMRFAGGIEGNAGAWKWDFTAQRTTNYFRQDSLNNRIQANWFAGIDAVYFNPTTGTIFTPTAASPTPPATAIIACRVNVDTVATNNLPGCVPINPFGAGSLTPTMQAWYKGNSYYDSYQRQTVFSANLRGTPFQTWAGDVLFATGAEYRRESIVSTSDPISQAGGWRSINQKGLAGKLTVKEGYVEIAVPLAKDAAFARSLEVNGAARYADYSSSGGVTTFKVGVNYTPINDIRFRGTYSRDIRAANVNELFSGQNQVITPLADVRPGAPAPQYQITQFTGGNLDLKPEKADTISFGAVLQPTFLPGFHAAVDYYSIDIKGAIASIAPAQIIANCAAGQAAFCSLLTINSANTITRVQGTLINTNKIETSGIDFEVTYRMAINAFGQPANLTFRGLANWVDTLAVTANGLKQDNVANLGSPDAGGVPEWRYNFDLTYQGGPLRLGVHYRYIAGGRYGIVAASSPTLPEQNRFHGKQYINLSGAYKLTENVELYGKIDNLFNVYPPIVPNAINQPTIANSQAYDKIGRFFVGGVRVAF